MNELLIAIYYGFLAKCCLYAGCFLNRINSVLLWVMNRIYGASGKLFDEAIRLFGKGEQNDA